jgi:hypothetical protein
LGVTIVHIFGFYCNIWSGFWTGFRSPARPFGEFQHSGSCTPEVLFDAQIPIKPRRKGGLRGSQNAETGYPVFWANMAIFTCRRVQNPRNTGMSNMGSPGSSTRGSPRTGRSRPSFGMVLWLILAQNRPKIGHIWGYPGGVPQEYPGGGCIWGYRVPYVFES